ncbi:MAG: S16 family serine protease [Syntrophobacter sp.]
MESGDLIGREPPAGSPQPRPGTVPQHAKTLKERIEEARIDPDIPRSVIELIEKNRMNAAGQSGAKYTELIETLLAIPWGKIKRIWVTPEEFENGLNRSHHGLRTPKEIICDFFANLIWRYQHFRESEKMHWHRTGSVLLFVGPPGVGKTSLAISIARNLGIPFHKISLGGMKDEADIRGYGFTYEGSKPGPIIQGLIKMGVMNGMFIMDEADKTEKIAIATLLEILDPEQNHLFHDKYTQTTVDIDLSNCHFILTANTIDTVPSAVLNRCEVIFLDRYSVEEKISIARDFLLQRVRERYLIGRDEIFFDPDEENEILRHLITDYTSEAGVRDLERIIRTLFLRVQRKEIMGEGKRSAKLTLNKIHRHLDEPNKPRLVNEDDRVGEMMGLGVNMELGVGTLIPIQVTPIPSGGRKESARSFLSMVHTTGNIERIMDESRKVASTAILHRSRELGIDSARMAIPLHLHFMGGSTRKDGPSAGAAIALALASLFKDRKIRRDVSMTGEVDTQGRITGVGGIGVKLETAYAAGSKTFIIPMENLRGRDAIERLPEALKQELQILTYKEWKAEHEPFDYARHMLQVIAVENIVQAADVAFIDEAEIDSVHAAFERHAARTAAELARNGEAPFKRLRLIYLDNPAEVTSGLFESGFCGEDYGCVFLLRSDAGEDILARLPEADEMIKIREFDPSVLRLSDVIGEYREIFAKPTLPPLRISVIAPLSFLRKEGIRSRDFSRDAGFVGIRFFANSCTAENLRIRDCRNLVSRTYPYLAKLDDELLGECPFIEEKDGIYSTTVALIPEKYRIDVRRAEEILDKGISRWLRIVTGRDEQEQAPEVCRLMK